MPNRTSADRPLTDHELDELEVDVTQRLRATLRVAGTGSCVPVWGNALRSLIKEVRDLRAQRSRRAK